MEGTHVEFTCRKSIVHVSYNLVLTTPTLRFTTTNPQHKALQKDLGWHTTLWTRGMTKTKLLLLSSLLLLPEILFAQSASTASNDTLALANPILQGHVDRFLAIINGADLYNETEYQERFSPSFIKQASLDVFDATAGYLESIASDWIVTEIESEEQSSEDNETTIIAVLWIAPYKTGDPVYVLLISMNTTSNQVNGLLVQPQDVGLESTPTTFLETLDQLHELGHNAHYIVADTTDSGSATDCLVLAGELTSKVAPIGSMFKLYVLQAVVQAVDNGLIQWDDGVKVTDESKSLPSGITQDDPAGTILTVEELAERMISISDNTATDLLIQLVGRSAVEHVVVESGHSQPDLNRPFLTTKELFVLKLVGAQGDGQPGPLGQEYILATIEERYALLDTLANNSISSYEMDLGGWVGPIAVEDLEWLASPMDLCRILSQLYPNEQARRLLSINPGIPDKQGLWSYIGFKGGSEPGVLGLAWYLVPNSTSTTTKDSSSRHGDAGPRVVTGTLWDPETVIDEAKSALLLGYLRDFSLSEDFGQSESDTPPCIAPSSKSAASSTGIAHADAQFATPNQDEEATVSTGGLQLMHFFPLALSVIWSVCSFY